jgi:glucosamine-phosphate N-acetyltransferase
MNIKKLDETDFDFGYLELLENLTTVGDISKEKAIQQFYKINKNDNIEIYVIFDASSNKIVASGTLLVEDKFIHQCGKVGHIEDIVVNPKYRGMGLGKKIITHLTERAKELECYKIILDCAEKNTEFYQKCGFSIKGIQMSIYY